MSFWSVPKYTLYCLGICFTFDKVCKNRSKRLLMILFKIEVLKGYEASPEDDQMVGCLNNYGGRFYTN